MKILLITFTLIVLSLSASNIKEMKQGWNLTTVPDSFLEIAPDSSYIWNYDTANKNWKAYSKIGASKLLEMKIPTLDNTTTAKAYWVYTYENFDIDFSGSAIEDFDYSTVEYGWNMLGTYAGISDLSFMKNDSSIAWMYKDGQWSVKLFNDIKTYNHQYSEFTSIPPKSGFWIFNDRDKFEVAQELNFQNLDPKYLAIITGENMNTNTSLSRKLNKSSSSNDSVSIASITSKLHQVMKSTVVSFQEKDSKQLGRRLYSTTQTGDIITVNETSNGSISGTETISFIYNLDTGSMTGTMSYSDYKNHEGDNCEPDYIYIQHGTWNIDAKFIPDPFELQSMVMSSEGSILIDGMTMDKGVVMSGIFNNASGYIDDTTFTINAEFSFENIIYGFKNYTYRDYEYNGYIWSYPVSGSIYIFDNQINGYFSVDPNFDQTGVPTKEDMCEIYEYQSKERYIGDNSSLTYTIVDTNQYLIEIDYGLDGTIDETFTGTSND